MNVGHQPTPLGDTTMNQNTNLTVGMLIDLLSRQNCDLPVVITMNGEYENYITEADVNVFLQKDGSKELYIGDVE
jgi:hypothetical protein